MEVSDAGYPPSRSQHSGINSCSSHRTKQGHMSVHGRQVPGLVLPDTTLLLDYLQRLLRKRGHM